MKPEDLRIVFMGTPDFAVASLDALVKAGLQVVAVVTAPDKPAGRGLHPTPSAVKKYAIEQGLPILQPEKLKDPAFINSLAQFKADVQVVVAFRMLPEVVWNMPPLGTINVHGSLLPQYRGAAPIHRAVMNGEKVTGVTTFRLQHAIDTGGILLQESLAIKDDENTGSVYEKLSTLGAQLLVKTIYGLAAGDVKEQSQENLVKEPLQHAPKIFTEDCIIHWEQTVEKTYNQIRGLSPSPGALSKLGDKSMKIYAATQEKYSHGSPPGTMETDGKNWLRFAAKDGWIYITDLQLEGKKRMQIADFLRGFRMEK
jgi:methionyl-tRNA formyltransferase